MSAMRLSPFRNSHEDDRPDNLPKAYLPSLWAGITWQSANHRQGEPAMSDDVNEYGWVYDYDEEAPTEQSIQDQSQAMQALISAASGPRRVQGDAGSVETHPIPDLIQAHRYLAGIIAASSPTHGLRFSRMIPDATVQGPRRSFRGRWLGWPSWNGYSWP